MATGAVIVTNNLSKEYTSRGQANTLALQNLNLAVQPGEIFGFLGPNGAGKTTTIRLLLDLIRPTAGSASIFGQDVRENSVDLHHQIGFMPGELNLWKNRTAKQVITYVASVRGDVSEQKRYAQTLAERLKFDMSKKVSDYSTGNKRKLGIILAMMHQPQLLILDEPTSGLDPLMQQTFNQMMGEYKQAGGTVFLSSHVLSEVKAICDRVGILRDGQLKAVEHVDALTHAEFSHVRVHLRDAVPQAWVARLQTIDGVSDVRADKQVLQLKLSGDFDPLLRVLNEGYVVDMHIEEPTLEDIFLTFYDDAGSQQRVPERAQVLS
ncbi:MAG: ATP-binding cassette domain-containing protein [Anaerolineae bacterium]